MLTQATSGDSIALRASCAKQIFLWLCGPTVWTATGAIQIFEQKRTQSICSRLIAGPPANCLVAIRHFQSDSERNLLLSPPIQISCLHILASKNCTCSSWSNVLELTMVFKDRGCSGLAISKPKGNSRAPEFRTVKTALRSLRRRCVFFLTRYAKRLLLKSSQGKTIKIKRIVNVKV